MMVLFVAHSHFIMIICMAVSAIQVDSDSVNSFSPNAFGSGACASTVCALRPSLLRICDSIGGPNIKEDVYLVLSRLVTTHKHTERIEERLSANQK